MKALEIRELSVEIAGKPVLRELNLVVPKGEVHALMGPNGTGKSTLAKVLAGNADYKVTGGSVLLDGEPILGLPPHEIARKGLFLAFQYPMALPGVSIANFIRAALQARSRGTPFSATAYYQDLYKKMDLLQIDRSFTARSVNDGFSGGEKKRCEVLQMLMLEPSYAVLDETDSGLDIDALRIVAEGVNHLRSPERGFLVITHYQRLLNYIVPDVVHVIDGGKIVQSGDKSLALELESTGYQKPVAVS